MANKSESQRAAAYRAANKERINRELREKRSWDRGVPVMAYAPALGIELETDRPEDDPNKPLTNFGPIKAAEMIGREDLKQRFLANRELVEAMTPEAFKIWARRRAEIMDAAINGRPLELSI